MVEERFCGGGGDLVEVVVVGRIGGMFLWGVVARAVPE